MVSLFDQNRAGYIESIRAQTRIDRAMRIARVRAPRFSARREPIAMDLVSVETLAAGVLIAEGALLAWVAWRKAAQSHFRPKHYPIYLVGLFFTRTLWRARVVGRMQWVKNRGAVVVCNHRGPIDPAFVGLACNGPVHWMVAKEYFAFPFFGTMLRYLEAVPTGRRGIDTAATKQILRYAGSGEMVGVFPEGRINTTDRVLLPCYTGAVVIALKARVPIVPCHVSGSPYDPQTFHRFLFQRARTVLRVGTPIDLSPYYDKADDRDVQENLTRRVLKAIAALAGRPDYEPELIARRRHRKGAGDAEASNGDSSVDVAGEGASSSPAEDDAESPAEV
jgi:1-acyl-sn-glycerol-3-phosphate acyltransferase